MLPEEQHVAEHKAELLMLEAQTKGGNQASQTHSDPGPAPDPTHSLY